ncbi:class F sortase [Frankia sp. AgKG'84/4]
MGAVLVISSGFRLAEPAFDGGRDGAGARAAAELPPVLAPPPSPAASPSGAAPPVLQRPAVVISDPNRLRITRLGVDAPVTHLGLAPDGSIEVPTRWGDVGWFDRGPAPGGIGPAVLVGHYDSTTGPAVFYRLGLLVPGDRVEVAGASGTSQAFIVDRSEQVTKATFPTQRVYGPVNRPELRLITCGGAFDYKTHHYLSNLIVYAHADTTVVPTLAAVPTQAAAAPGVAPGPVPAAVLPGPPAAPPAVPPAAPPAVPPAAPPAVPPAAPPAVPPAAPPAVPPVMPAA